MPLFFMISGYIYKSNKEKITGIIIKNVMTFYIPYLILNYLYWTERIVALEVFGIQLSQNEYSGGIKLSWAGEGITWFLLSMLLAKTLFNILDTYKSDVFACMAFSLVFWLSCIFPYKILYYLQWGTFFCMGYMINKYQIEKKQNSVIYICCINLLLVGVERYILCGLDKFVKIFIGASVFIIYMCIKRIPDIRFLEPCGRHSLVIYMLHGLLQYPVYYVAFEILHLRVHFVLLLFIIGLQILLAFLTVMLFTRVKYFHWMQALFYPYKYINGKRRR